MIKKRKKEKGKGKNVGDVSVEKGWIRSLNLMSRTW